MFQVDINELAVLVSGIIAMIIGALWYSPVLFANAWTQLTGIQGNAQSGAAKQYIAAFLLNLLLVYVLAHAVGYVGATTIMDGALTGLWSWVGFVATSAGMNYMFESKPAKLFWINTGMTLVTLVICGAILAIWR